MRTTLFIFLFLLSYLPMVGQGIVRPFEGLEGHRTIGGPDFPTVDVMECDEEGNVYLAGTFEEQLVVAEGNVARYYLNGTVGEPSLYLMKLDSNLDVIWVKTMPFAGRAYSLARRIRFDQEGNPILQGKYHYNIQFDDGTFLGDTVAVLGSSVFFAKADPDGNWLDIWDMRADQQHVWLGDFQILENREWKIAIAEVKMPMYLPADTLDFADSIGVVDEIQMVDLSLDENLNLKSSNFIRVGKEAKIIGSPRAVVDKDGNSHYHFQLDFTSHATGDSTELWIGNQVFLRPGWKLVKFDSNSQLLYLSRKSKLSEKDFIHPFFVADDYLFYGGREDYGRQLHIDQINNYGRKKHEFLIDANLGDHVADLEMVGDHELWITGWYKGTLRGEDWSVGYDVDWGYQPTQGYLISLDTESQKINWVCSQPLRGDKNIIKSMSMNSEHYFLHSSWESDTLIFDTLGLSDFWIWPKTFIGKFRRPESESSPEELKLGVWPNPADERVWIGLGKAIPDSRHWELIDQGGKKVLSGQVNSQRFVSMALEKIPSGIYIFRLPGEDSPNIRVLVQH